jgi:polyhydroxybutyrate depolymerase
MAKRRKQKSVIGGRNGMSRPVVIAAMAILCSVAIDRSACAETMQLAVDGKPRTYLLERPNTPGPSPTIIMLHGANGTAERIAEQTGLGRLAPQNGFIAVFPQSSANIWNRNFPGHESPQTVEYFRRYFMALSMFCLEGGLFGGLGLIVTSMIEQTGAECSPRKPMPVIMLNGTADEMVLYAGGPATSLDPRLPSPYNTWSRDHLVTFFRRFNDCLQPAETSALPGQHPQRIEVDRSTNCYFGPVIAYRVIDGTHGSTPAALDSDKLLLDFFRDMGGR